MDVFYIRNALRLDIGWNIVINQCRCLPQISLNHYDFLVYTDDDDDKQPMMMLITTMIMIIFVKTRLQALACACTQAHALTHTHI